MNRAGFALLAALWILAGSLSASTLLLASARIEWSAAHHAKERAEAHVQANRLERQVRRVLADTLHAEGSTPWPPQPDPLDPLVASGLVASVRWVDDGVRFVLQVNREDVNLRLPRYYLRP
jgi:hypothetical protein